jgi:hypothetical protein
MVTTAPQGMVLTPIPDPTVLTTAALQREVAALEKLLDQRINAIEQAVKVAHENLVRVPTDVDKAIAHLRELLLEKFATTGEKFNSIQTQFLERDVRVEQTAKDSKVAVDAALQAAKEAVGEQNKSSGLSIAKSEAATTKQIEQQAVLMATTNAGILSSLADLKERQTRFETELVTRRQTLTERQSSGNTFANWGGLIIGAILAIVGIVSLASHLMTTH